MGGYTGTGLKRALIFAAVMLAALFVFPVAASAADWQIGGVTELYCCTDEGFTKETCVLAAVSDHAAVYVMDDPNMTADDKFKPTGASPSRSAQDLAAEFDRIYDLLCTPGLDTYFGQPYDINGDGRVTIILMDIDSDNNTEYSYVAGCFVSSNFDAYNEADVIYLDIASHQGYYDFLHYTSSFYSTLAHEFTHLINYSYAYKSDYYDTMELWLDEGLAELAALLYSGEPLEDMLDAFLARRFLAGASMIPTLRQWIQAEVQYSFDYIGAMYGSSMMAALNYYESGASIHELVSGARPDDTGRSLGIVGAKYTGGAMSDQAFNDFFTDFMLRVYVDDPSGENIGYNLVDINTWDSISVSTGDRLSKGVAKEVAIPAAYFGRPYVSSKIGAGNSVVTISAEAHTDADYMRFFAVYPSAGAANTDVRAAKARSFTEIIPGRTNYVEVGENNSFAVIAVAYNNTDSAASLLYGVASGMPLAPDAPTGLRAAASGGVTFLTWEHSGDEASFVVYRDGKPIGTASGLFFADSAPVAGAEHVYAVAAVSDAGESAPSTDVAVPPPSPSGREWAQAHDWALPELDAALAANLVPAGLLSADMSASVTREEFCEISVLLYERLSGMSAPSDGSPFADTENPYVAKAFNLGITTGVSATQFGPGLSVSRQEAAVMLYRAIRLALPQHSLSASGALAFGDAALIQDWARDAVSFMTERGILNGFEDGNFHPDRQSTHGVSTRQQAIAIAVRAAACAGVL